MRENRESRQPSDAQNCDSTSSIEKGFYSLFRGRRNPRLGPHTSLSAHFPGLSRFADLGVIHHHSMIRSSVSKFVDTQISDSEYRPLTTSDLIAPVALHQVGGIGCQSSQETLGAEEGHRTASTQGTLGAHADLDVADAHDEEGSHGVVQERAVPAVKLGDGGEDEGVWHVLKKVQVAAALEEERVGVLVVAGVVLVAVELIADPLLVLDALVDDAVGEDEEVGGKG